MNLFKCSAVIIVIAALLILLSGCLESATVTPPAPAPGGQVIPIPIPGTYMLNRTITADKIVNGTITTVNIATSAVNDTQLASNVIPYNVTVSTTGATITGTSYGVLNNNGSITVNRTSFVVVQWSGEIGINGTNSSYLLITFGGANMTTTPQIIATNGSYSTLISGTRTVLAYNASVVAGTYAIVPYVNGTQSDTVVTVGKNILLTTAYPHN